MSIDYESPIKDREMLAWVDGCLVTAIKIIAEQGVPEQNINGLALAEVCYSMAIERFEKK